MFPCSPSRCTGQMRSGESTGPITCCTVVLARLSWLRTGRSVNGKRPKWTPYRSKTPSPMKTKLNTIHYVPRNSPRAKTYNQPIKGVRPTKGQHISFLLVFFLLFLFYFVRFLAQRPAKTALPILTVYTCNDAVSRKEVPFGGSNACKNFQAGHFPPKHPRIGPPIGISS